MPGHTYTRSPSACQKALRALLGMHPLAHHQPMHSCLPPAGNAPRATPAPTASPWFISGVPLRTHSPFQPCQGLLTHSQVLPGDACALQLAHAPLSAPTACTACHPQPFAGEQGTGGSTAGTPLPPQPAPTAQKEKRAHSVKGACACTRACVLPEHLHQCMCKRLL